MDDAEMGSDERVARVQALYERAAGVGEFRDEDPCPWARGELVADTMEENEHLSVEQQQVLVAQVRENILRLRAYHRRD